MRYADRLVVDGQHLFRWRSYLPVLFLIPLLLSVRHFSYMGDSHRLDLVWEGFCLLVSFAGLAIRIHVVGHAPAGTSGRNTADGQVARTLSTTGLYSLVRHPLYVGNLLMWLGIAMFLHDWRIVALVSVVFWLYYERIILAEEHFLRSNFGQTFDDWASRTPTFVPKLRGYVAPALPFSARNALRREYSGLFAVVATMYAFEVLGDLVVHGELEFDPIWLTVFGATFLVYATLRTLKKHTRVLDAPGR